MNYHRKYRRTALNVCRKCGMDSGIRKVTDSVPEEYFVECEICGFKTKRHKSLPHATREWNGGKNVL